jgi:hypothetical protein
MYLVFVKKRKDITALKYEDERKRPQVENKEIRLLLAILKRYTVELEQI